eukprot:5098286-Amphidinium_carterae.2
MLLNSCVRATSATSRAPYVAAAISAAATQASEPNLQHTELNDLASEYASKTWELKHHDRNQQRDISPRYAADLWPIDYGQDLTSDGCVRRSLGVDTELMNIACTKNFVAQDAKGAMGLTPFQKRPSTTWQRDVAEEGVEPNPGPRKRTHEQTYSIIGLRLFPRQLQQVSVNVVATLCNLVIFACGQVTGLMLEPTTCDELLPCVKKSVNCYSAWCGRA